MIYLNNDAKYPVTMYLRNVLMGAALAAQQGTTNIMCNIAAAFGTIAGWTLSDGMMYHADTNSWVFEPTTDRWKQMLEYTNKLYSAGVLDEEFATLDSNVYVQRIVQGKTFMMIDWIQNLSTYIPQGKAIDPDFELSVIYPPKGTDDNHALGWASAWSLAICLSSKLKDDPEHLQDVLSYLDWGYTDEAEVLLNFGVEGEDFVKDSDGVMHGKDPNVNYSATAGLGSNDFVIRESIDKITGFLSKEDRDLVAQIAQDNIVPMPNPTAPLSIEQLEETKVYSATLSDYVKSMMEKFIMGKEPLSNWDSFVQGCKEKGSTRLEEAYRTAMENKD
ncbi:MAG: hypothetical protein ACFWTN_08905 [Clostridium sp.]